MFEAHSRRVFCTPYNSLTHHFRNWWVLDLDLDPTLNILDPWWPLASVTSAGERLLRWLHFESWKRSGEAHQSLLLPNQAIQHHLCDSARIWMWILGSVRQHGKQDKCICYILWKDHAKHQVSWLYKQCKNPWDDEHPASHQHCQTAPTASSLEIRSPEPGASLL